MQKIAFNLQLKELGEDGTFSGYASTFGNKDQGGDIVMPGAFKKALKAKGPKGVKMLADHNPTQRIGVWTMIQEDAKGLKVEGRLLTEKNNGREAYVDLKAGALDGLSIGGRTATETYDSNSRARLIKEFDLYEISLVSFPMNEEARVEQVKAADCIKTIREFESFLRDVGGFSHAAAKAIAAGGFKASDPRDEDGAVIQAILARYRAAHRS